MDALISLLPEHGPFPFFLSLQMPGKSEIVCIVIGELDLSRNDRLNSQIAKRQFYDNETPKSTLIFRSDLNQLRM